MGGIGLNLMLRTTTNKYLQLLMEELSINNINKLDKLTLIGSKIITMSLLKARDLLELDDQKALLVII